jgi:hypothetical protein
VHLVEGIDILEFVMKMDVILMSGEWATKRSSNQVEREIGNSFFK